jgi:hypothetical protein
MGALNCSMTGLAHCPFRDMNATVGREAGCDGTVAARRAA